MFVPHTKDMLQINPGDFLETPEIRVWVHPPNGGSDTCRVFESFNSAEDFIKVTPGAEDVPLIAFKGIELNLYAMQPDTAYNK